MSITNYYIQTVGLQIRLFKYVFALLLCSSVNVIAQVEEGADSLNTDSVGTPKIKLSNQDSVAGFQPIDSINEENLLLAPIEKKNSPARATLYSAILPGLGQAYNDRYWKIPIIYTLFAGMYFLVEDNNNQYVRYRDAYKNFDTDKPVWLNESITKDRLKQIKDDYKRKRDLNIILGVLVYLLNILDANVDAHLMDYDISDDLSLNVKPDINYFQAYQKNQQFSSFGLKFVLSLHK